MNVGVWHKQTLPSQMSNDRDWLESETALFRSDAVEQG
jgi:hypothetical protein